MTDEEKEIERVTLDLHAITREVFRGEKPDILDLLSDPGTEVSREDAIREIKRLRRAVTAHERNALAFKLDYEMVQEELEKAEAACGDLADQVNPIEHENFALKAEIQRMKEAWAAEVQELRDSELSEDTMNAFVLVNARLRREAKEMQAEIEGLIRERDQAMEDHKALHDENTRFRGVIPKLVELRAKGESDSITVEDWESGWMAGLGSAIDEVRAAIAT